MRFELGLTNDELFDLINDLTNNCGETSSIISELEAEYGEIISASSSVRHAIERGLIPFVGGKYDGFDEEYHHIEFENGVESIPFKVYE